MWRRCHWASVSQPEGRAVARLGPRRQSRAADVGGTAATDAHCSGGGAEPPPPQTPTWAAVVGGALPPAGSGFTVDTAPPGDLGAPLVGRTLLYWWPDDGWKPGTVART